MSTLVGAGTVGELYGVRHNDADRFREIELAGSEFIGDVLRVGNPEGGPHDVLVAEGGLDAVARFFQFPAGALQKLPTRIKVSALEWMRKQNEEARATLELDGTELVGIWHQEKALIPRSRVIEAIHSIVPEDTRIRRLDLTGGQLSVDLLSDAIQVEPRVGDVTLGGMRVYAHVQPSRGQKQQPRVAPFWERLVCTNGMTRTEEDGKVLLRGDTVDEVIDELEKACERIWGTVLPERLEQYSHLASIDIPGEPAQMIHRLARENGIGERLESAAIDRIPSLENHTLYDLMNLINGLQHEDGVRGTQYLRLQELAGHMATDHGQRCPSCLTALN